MEKWYSAGGPADHALQSTGSASQSSTAKLGLAGSAESATTDSCTARSVSTLTATAERDRKTCVPRCGGVVAQAEARRVAAGEEDEPVVRAGAVVAARCREHATPVVLGQPVLHFGGGGGGDGTRGLVRGRRRLRTRPAEPRLDFVGQWALRWRLFGTNDSEGRESQHDSGVEAHSGEAGWERIEAELASGVNEVESGTRDGEVESEQQEWCG